ncbi:hypothetical protein OR62_05375 [Clostridium tetani]|uniref:ImmA/IrrE family metallo-endopeptidase n=1 Tax=Clostridium tetani TaxID=1513 RepID=A0ABY0EP21_CLOTA|nr:ImmA/IrrE family metallo-endopeptidase [Clostridium tetani]AVP54490.1 ImmA/IrrE family metallo-endopeptidase [Clostridium tetani]KHO39683.1 hypothetical protein OR62_05375 [Clostridium tetani]RXI55490.1 ImmA/IrrE family metallo-endopeptidase [Clostridium tetani]RXI68561.1 ImmA/IrrE family metallo-endopeptidase [Clostridium tetani]
MSYDTLLDEAFNNDIMVKEIDLKTKDGLCYGNRIAINKKLTTNREKSCILAEELGHFYTTVGDITDQSKIVNLKQEVRARRWSYEKLIGIIDLVNAYNNGARDKYTLADYLNVTEEFLEEAINYYKTKYGLYYEIDNYLIYFEPTLGVMKIF